MGKIKTYRDLDAWNEVMNLTEMVYALTRVYPKDELYGLTGQTRRAAISIPANLAEGHARGSKKEYRQFVSISRGSLAELETHLILAQRLKYLPRAKMKEIWPLTQTVGRLINGLKRSLT